MENLLKEASGVVEHVRGVIWYSSCSSDNVLLRCVRFPAFPVYLQLETRSGVGGGHSLHEVHRSTRDIILQSR